MIKHFTSEGELAEYQRILHDPTSGYHFVMNHDKTNTPTLHGIGCIHLRDNTAIAGGKTCTTTEEEALSVTRAVNVRYCSRFPCNQGGT